MEPITLEEIVNVIVNINDKFYYTLNSNLYNITLIDENKYQMVINRRQLKYISKNDLLSFTIGAIDLETMRKVLSKRGCNIENIKDILLDNLNILYNNNESKLIKWSASNMGVEVDYVPPEYMYTKLWERINKIM